MYDPEELTDLPPRPSRARGPRILVVDDDPDFLELAEAALTGEGFQVELARTPGEAVMSAVRSPPDVVLLDILLRTGDCIDVLDALRAEPETRYVPVLACTAMGERDSAAMLTNLGFDAVMAKPLDLLQLARELRATVPTRAQ